MGIVVAQSQEVDAQGQLAPLVTMGETGAAGTAALSVLLPVLATDAAGGQSMAASVRGVLVLAQAAQTAATQQARGIAALGPLASLIHVQALNVNIARIVATLPRLAASGTVTASQPAVAKTTLGAITSAIVVQAINVNTARIVASLPRLRSAGTSAATGSARAVATLRATAKASAAATQVAHASAFLPRLWASVSVGAQGSAYIDATLGPLAAKGTIGPPPSGYAADGNYYVALASRPFYATIAPRSFYAAAQARSFYILSDPDMTPTFDTLDPREEHVLTLDATPDLADGETLTAISEITAVLQSGASGSELPTLAGQLVNTEPLALTVNGKAVTVASGCAVQVIASGGVSGCRYLIAVTCTTSNPDKVLTLKGVLPVSAN